MNSKQYIIELARTFPSLRHSVPRDPEKWDVDQFMNSLGRASSGERQAMLFVATVWNPIYAESQGWIFKIPEAFGSWDAAHRDAFVEWAKCPVWP